MKKTTTIIEKVGLFLYQYGGAVVPISILVVVFIYSMWERNRLEKRFTSGIQVDSVYAEIVSKKYFKNAYTYRVQFYADGKKVEARLRDYIVPDNMKIGWKIPIAYLEDEPDEIVFLPHAKTSIIPRQNDYGTPIVTDTITTFSPFELYEEMWIEKTYSLDETYVSDTAYMGKEMVSITGRTRDNRVTTERVLIHKDYNLINLY